MHPQKRVSNVETAVCNITQWYYLAHTYLKSQNTYNRISALRLTFKISAQANIKKSQYSQFRRYDICKAFSVMSNYDIIHVHVCSNVWMAIWTMWKTPWFNLSIMFNMFVVPVYELNIHPSGALIRLPNNWCILSIEMQHFTFKYRAVLPPCNQGILPLL